MDSLSALGITAVDPLTSAIFNQLVGEFDTSNNTDETEQTRALTRLGIVGFVGQIATQKDEDLKRRLAEIALLTSPDLATWAAAEGVAAGADFEETQGKIQDNAKAASAQVFLDNARTQKQILDDIAANPGSINGFHYLETMARPTDLGQFGRRDPRRSIQGGNWPIGGNPFGGGLTQVGGASEDYRCHVHDFGILQPRSGIPQRRDPHTRAE